MFGGMSQRKKLLGLVLLLVIAVFLYSSIKVETHVENLRIDDKLYNEENDTGRVVDYSIEPFILLTDSDGCDIRKENIIGSIVHQQSWTDSRGKWNAIVTIAKSKALEERGEIRFYKFNEDKDGIAELWHEYVDTLSCGEADLVTAVDTKRLIVSDVDGNGLAEVTFVYTLSCTYDVSPQRRLLVMSVDSSVHMLEGYTLDYGSKIPEQQDLTLEKYDKDENGFWDTPITAGRYINKEDFSQLSGRYMAYADSVWMNVLIEDNKRMQDLSD